MCRLLGFVSPTATTLDALIGAAQCATFRSMSRLHADGWGTAWWEESGSTPVLRRLRDTVPPAAESPLVGAMAVEQARSRLVHLRMATAGLPLSLANTHPFLAEDMAFAHNGAIPIAPLRERLTDPRIAATVRGETDSELMFALIRQRHQNGVGLLDAVCEVLTELRLEAPTASYNALLLAADQLIVIHASENSALPLKEFDESGLLREELPIEHLEHYYRMSYLRLDDGATAFASTGIASAGWTPLPLGSVTSVSLDGARFETRPIGELTSAAAPHSSAPHASASGSRTEPGLSTVRFSA